MRRLEEAGSDTVIRFTFEGREIEAREGDSVATALLVAGVRSFRDSVVSQSPRAPYCMMGACFECLAEIDGVANRQTCMVEAAPGMRVARQIGSSEVVDES